MRVLTLDPGERVGWACAEVAEDGQWSELKHGITPLRDMAMAVHRALDHEAAYDLVAYDLVVMEDWRLRPTVAREFIGSAFPSVQFIGMVKLCCWLSGTKLVMQGASTKATADKTMKRLWPEMYAKVTEPRAHDDAHDIDAIRHLWFYTYQNTSLSHFIQAKEAAPA